MMVNILTIFILFKLDKTQSIIEPAGNTGIDPETAANDSRAILDAGGKGSGIFAQRGALLEWAERAERRYRESFWIAEAAKLEWKRVVR